MEALKKEQGVTENLGSTCDHLVGLLIRECFMEINKDLKDDRGDKAIKVMWT